MAHSKIMFYLLRDGCSPFVVVVRSTTITSRTAGFLCKKPSKYSCPLLPSNKYSEVVTVHGGRFSEDMSGLSGFITMTLPRVRVPFTKPSSPLVRIAHNSYIILYREL